MPLPEKAARIRHQRLAVEALRLQYHRTTDPMVRATLGRRLSAAAQALRQLLPASPRYAERSGPRTEALAPDQAKARLAVVGRELTGVTDVLTRLEGLIRQGKGPPAARHRYLVQRNMLFVRRKVLNHRLKLLQSGRDMEQPLWLHPSRVHIQRQKLELPALYNVPTAAEVAAIIRLLASVLRRRSVEAESDRSFRTRLASYAKRALVRYINTSQVERVPLEQAMSLAVQETIAGDTSALEAEAEQGGVVPDEEADTVAPAVEASAAIAEVASDSQPAPSTSTEQGDMAIPPAEVDKILVDAETAEAQAVVGAEPTSLAVDAIIPEPTAIAMPIAMPAAALAKFDEEAEEGFLSGEIYGIPKIYILGGVVIVLGSLLFMNRE